MSKKDNEAKGSHKHETISRVLLYVSYTIITAIFILNTVNTLVLAHTSNPFLYWIHLGLSVISILSSLGIYYLIFLLFKTFKSSIFYISITVLNVLVALFSIFIYKASNFKALYITLLSLMGAFDLFLLILSCNIKLPSLLFNIASQRLFKLKKDILKNLLKELVLLFTCTCISCTSIVLGINNYVTTKKISNTTYLQVCAIVTILLTLISLFTVIHNSYLNHVLLGVLILVNHYKYKHTTDIESNKETKEQKNNTLSCFEDLNNKYIRNKFFKTSTNDYSFEYGKTTYIRVKQKEVILSKYFMEEINRGEASLHWITTMGSFIYSLIYNVTLEEATKMHKKACYFGGYLELVNVPMLKLFMNTIGVVISLIVTIMVSVLFIAISYLKYDLSDINWWVFANITGTTFVSLYVIIGCVNGLFYGYTETTVCLFIEDPEVVLIDRRYWKRLKAYMDGARKTKIINNI
eukprot:GAHX01002405.1.p1 GENE.GAHX01002405.1~~GAHX01002405.1.p1  ORF type:complete len:465 (-),score=47.85 GAHX01002405.1:20-1414(-)